MKLPAVFVSASLLALSLAACSTAAPGDGAGDASPSPQAAPSPADTANDPAPSPTSQPSTSGSQPAGVFAAVRSSASAPIPEALLQGSFAVRNGCLVFETGDSSPYLALLPSGSSYGPDGIRAKGGTVPLGKAVTIAGGSIPAGTEREYGLAASPPANCPRAAIAIGEIR